MMNYECIINELKLENKILQNQLNSCAAGPLEPYSDEAYERLRDRYNQVLARWDNVSVIAYRRQDGIWWSHSYAFAYAPDEGMEINFRNNPDFIASINIPQNVNIHMLTDEEIAIIAQPFLEDYGDRDNHDYISIVYLLRDLTRAIEKEVISRNCKLNPFQNDIK